MSSGLPSGVHIVVAGGHGLLGGALVSRLRQDGHAVSVLTRSPRRAGDIHWDPAVVEPAWQSAVAGADAVINLAGESIAGRRWSATRKAAILESRVQATRALARAVLDSSQPPSTFISGSAIGIYGPHGDEEVTEATPPGGDFLAQVCQAWEREAQAIAGVTRLVLARTGVVLARHGGALPEMARPFRFFAGGPVGSGRQFVSWIHIDDWVDMMRWALTSPALLGAVNLTAPCPVTNREFASALGRTLGRPSVVTAPAFALRIGLGEMADIVLTGQRVIPARSAALGFEFHFRELDPALRSLYR